MSLHNISYTSSGLGPRGFNGVVGDDRPRASTEDRGVAPLLPKPAAIRASLSCT